MARLSYYCATYGKKDPKHGVGCNGCGCDCHPMTRVQDKGKELTPKELEAGDRKVRAKVSADEKKSGKSRTLNIRTRRKKGKG